MSGIFSMASHWALQYFPEVVVHEQTGCAHFTAVVLDSFGGVIVFLLAFNRVVIQVSIDGSARVFCAIRHRFCQVE
jgi:hypothetical protein